MMEKAMVVYKQGDSVNGKIADKYVSVASDSIYWPFQGEYWLDELGYHKFRLENACEEEE